MSNPTRLPDYASSNTTNSSNNNYNNNNNESGTGSRHNKKQILETFSIYSERCSALLETSLLFYLQEAEKELTTKTSGTNSTDSIRNHKYAQPGVIYRHGKPIVDFTKTEIIVNDDHNDNTINDDDDDNRKLQQQQQRVNHYISSSSSDVEEVNNINNGNTETLLKNGNMKNHVSDDSDNSSNNNAIDDDDDDDSSEDEEEDGIQSGQVDESIINEESDNNEQDAMKASTSTITASNKVITIPKKNKINKASSLISKMNEKQYDQLIRKHWETVPVITFQQPQSQSQPQPQQVESSIAEKKQPYLSLLLSSSSSASWNRVVLELPVSLLLSSTNEDVDYATTSTANTTSTSFSQRCHEYQTLLSEMKMKQEKKECAIVIFCVRSGRFAGGVFTSPSASSMLSLSRNNNNDNNNNNNKTTVQDITKQCCLVHRTSIRYTVRKGQGKAQSSQDNQRRPKSMGAQLRRAGEVQLQYDIAKTIIEWKEYIKQANYIFISIPKTMQKYFYDAVTDSNNSSSSIGGSVAVSTVLTKHDPRIRRVPLDIGRPSFESVCLIHTVMTTAVLVWEEQLYPSPNDENGNVTEREEAHSSEGTKIKSSEIGQDESSITSEKKLDYPPFTDLHIAAMEGNVVLLKSMIENKNTSLDEWKDQRAGEMYMTPLHIATESTSPPSSIDPNIASEFVTILLQQIKCNPCIVDVRNRVPYFLATHDKVRDAFRISRAVLGEEYCSWVSNAKVGPPLTPADIQARKDKDAEKKRKKRQRLKEKKEQEKIAAAQLEQQRIQEEEHQQQVVNAQRIRDGLSIQSKGSTSIVPPGGKLCDYCQTICIGKKRINMFQRLSYWYCTTECVNQHKRELMAKAALARLEK